MQIELPCPVLKAHHFVRFSDRWDQGYAWCTGCGAKEPKKG